MRSRTRLVVVTSIVAAVFAGCGNSGGEDDDAGGAASTTATSTEPPPAAEFAPCDLLTADEVLAHAQDGATAVEPRPNLLNWRFTTPVATCIFADAGEAVTGPVEVGIVLGDQSGPLVELLHPAADTADPAGPGGWPAQPRQPLEGVGDEGYVSYQANRYRVVMQVGDVRGFLSVYAPAGTREGSADITALATLVAERIADADAIPTDPVLLLEPCDAIGTGAAEELFGAPVAFARGGSGDASANCAYLAADGTSLAVTVVRGVPPGWDVEEARTVEHDLGEDVVITASEGVSAYTVVVADAATIRFSLTRSEPESTSQLPAELSPAVAEALAQAVDVARGLGA